MIKVSERVWRTRCTMPSFFVCVLPAKAKHNDPGKVSVRWIDLRGKPPNAVHRLRPGPTRCAGTSYRISWTIGLRPAARSDRIRSVHYHANPTDTRVFARKAWSCQESKRPETSHAARLQGTGNIGNHLKIGDWPMNGPFIGHMNNQPIELPIPKYRRNYWKHYYFLAHSQTWHK